MWGCAVRAALEPSDGAGAEQELLGRLCCTQDEWRHCFCALLPFSALQPHYGRAGARVLQGTQMVNELLPFIEMNFVWLSNKHLLLFSS